MPRTVAPTPFHEYGVTDPHVRIFNDRAYLYASHDEDPAATTFIMPDWQIWSSDDLVHWSHETTIQPEDTHIGKPHKGCWATDAIEKDGKFYWCFSEVDHDTGVRQVGLMVSDTPTGPWKNAVGEGPWLAADLADTHVYDPCLFRDERDGSLYVLFGVWDYYICKLGDDLVSLAEAPRKLHIENPHGPYGAGKTDDKVFLHQRGERYYLSWGAFYATSDSPYGPFEYKGCIVEPDKLAPAFRSPTWPHGPQQGRHGSFFTWNEQWYFSYCDMSHSGNRYFRGTWFSYVHYRNNGEIAPITMDENAVGRYNAAHPIAAANFFKASGIEKVDTGNDRFGMRLKAEQGTLQFPNVTNLRDKTTLRCACLPEQGSLQVTLRRDHADGEVLATGKSDESLELAPHADVEHLSISIRGTGTLLALVFA